MATQRRSALRLELGYHHKLLRIHVGAIIFDYGNVLCTSPLAAEIERMAGILGMPVADFQQSYWRDRLAFDRAAVDAAAYWNAVAGRQLSAVDVGRLQDIDSASWSHPCPIMPEWAQRVRAAGFRTGLLSNMPAPVRDYIVRCPWLPEFDHTTFSCDLHSTKPSPEIYQHSLAGLGVSSSDALLLDDRVENIRAAEAMGIHGILFTTPQALPQELDRRFAIHVPLVVK
jgi:putative hydrolase of the HAD superfamily